MEIETLDLFIIHALETHEIIHCPKTWDTNHLHAPHLIILPLRIPPPAQIFEEYCIDIYRLKWWALLYKGCSAFCLMSLHSRHCQVVPIGPQWFQLVPIGPNWSQVVLSGPKWSQVVPNGPKWSQVVPSGPKWSQRIKSRMVGFNIPMQPWSNSNCVKTDWKSN